MQVFPRDPATYAIDSQFMLGDALMGIPIITQGEDSVDGYLPNEDWFNYFTYTRLTSYNASSSTGTVFSFCSALDDTAHVPLIQRGGSTVFTQTPMLTTAETRKQPFTMQVALDWQGRSMGQLALDDGMTIGNIAARRYNAFTATARLTVGADANITGHIEHTAQHLAPEYDISKLFVQRIIVLGADLADGANLPTPTLTVDGKQTSLNGLKMQVVNGAIVLDDNSASILPAGRNWELRWTAAADQVDAPAASKSAVATE